MQISFDHLEIMIPRKGFDFGHDEYVNDAVLQNADCRVRQKELEPLAHPFCDDGEGAQRPKSIDTTTGELAKSSNHDIGYTAKEL